MPLGLLMILSVNSCGSGRPKFDPNAYKANHRFEAIINENQHVVYASDEEFSDFACMHKNKWIELRQFVQMFKIPQDQKDLLIKNLIFAAEGDRR
jgi:hypothetical protein